MKKKIIIDDENIYVKSKESGSRIDIYYNRKALNSNVKRGHTVISEGEVVFSRPAPALDIVRVSGTFNVCTSGSLTCPI